MPKNIGKPSNVGFDWRQSLLSRRELPKALQGNFKILKWNPEAVFIWMIKSLESNLSQTSFPSLKWISFGSNSSLALKCIIMWRWCNRKAHGRKLMAEDLWP